MIGFTILIVICVLTILAIIGLYITMIIVTLKDKDYPMFFFVLGSLIFLIVMYLGYYLYSIGV